LYVYKSAGIATDGISLLYKSDDHLFSGQNGRRSSVETDVNIPVLSLKTLDQKRFYPKIWNNIVQANGIFL